KSKLHSLADTITPLDLGVLCTVIQELGDKGVATNDFQWDEHSCSVTVPGRRELSICSFAKQWGMKENPHYLYSSNFFFNSSSSALNSCSAWFRFSLPSVWILIVSSMVSTRFSCVFFSVSISTRPLSFSLAVSIAFVFNISAFFSNNSLVVFETCFCASTASRCLSNVSAMAI